MIAETNIDQWHVKRTTPVESEEPQANIVTAISGNMGQKLTFN